MIVGILSDTHDKLPAMKAGLRVLSAAGATFICHCGDIGREPLIDLLAGLPSAFVWGNTDWDRYGLEEYAVQLGIKCLGHGGRIELGGKSVYITHGDEPAQVRRVLEEQKDDYLLLGHTHVWNDQRHDRVRVINPGALYRAARKTVAVLDTERDAVQFLDVPGL